jgi:hypothetical protein
MQKRVLATLLIALPSLCVADTGTAQWNVAAPPLPLREIPIDVEQGTWMNIDMSPDGKQIDFETIRPR